MVLRHIELPVYGVLAGLGVGGLAVARAIRPTLEGMIGGFILYLDKPTRVGDYCSFGDQNGKVETMGARSTQVRGIFRTLISIPSAACADMRLVNFAPCDKLLIDMAISLRYETKLASCSRGFGRCSMPIQRSIAKSSA